jgi:hypothetical protein
MTCNAGKDLAVPATIRLLGALGGSESRHTRVTFESNVGRFAWPLWQPEIVDYAPRHEHEPRNDPHLSALSGFPFDDVAIADGMMEQCGS